MSSYEDVCGDFIRMLFTKPTPDKNQPSIRWLLEELYDDLHFWLGAEQPKFMEALLYRDGAATGQILQRALTHIAESLTHSEAGQRWIADHTAPGGMVEEYFR